MTTPTTAPITARPAHTARGILLQCLSTALLGLILLYAAGFSHSPLAHNAAHDVRHANGRPCH